jgi:hypothetical protein
MISSHSDPTCLRAADTLLRDHFCLREGESVAITVDSDSDAQVVRALTDRVTGLGGRSCVLAMARLPFQGALSDPYIPDPVQAAVAASDVWLDLTFPYMAGSGPFDRAMEAKRTRYLLLGDVRADGFGRLYGQADFDDLFRLQLLADGIFEQAQGQPCRVTSPSGTDFSFVMGRPATRKLRHANQPGAQTVPGSAIFYPELESVRGIIVLDAVFDERYRHLATPLTLEVDATVKSVKGGSQAKTMERALLRAGGGRYGNVVHITLGLHPFAASTGRSFIEDIRVMGCNAIGLGLPWWLPGGGENHPDGVVMNQSLWIGDRQLVADGLPLADGPLAQAWDSLASLRPGVPQAGPQGEP